MTLTSSKWAIGLLILIVALFILLLIGKKSVSTEMTINAPREKIWAVLTDISQVANWNRVPIPVNGAMIEGSTITYEFYQEEDGKVAVMDAQVSKLVPHWLINQKGGMSLILTFDHKYLLEEINGKTTVKINEQYNGIMVPFWNPAPVEKAYERLLLQLKNRIENE